MLELKLVEDLLVGIAKNDFGAPEEKDGEDAGADDTLNKADEEDIDKVLNGGEGDADGDIENVGDSVTFLSGWLLLSASTCKTSGFWMRVTIKPAECELGGSTFFPDSENKLRVE